MRTNTGSGGLGIQTPSIASSAGEQMWCNSSWTVELEDDCEDEVPGFSPAKRYIVETASLVLDFHQYFSDVVCNHQRDNAVSAPSAGAPRVFRKSYGSDDRAGVQRRPIYLSLRFRSSRRGLYVYGSLRSCFNRPHDQVVLKSERSVASSKAISFG